MMISISKTLILILFLVSSCSVHRPPLQPSLQPPLKCDFVISRGFDPSRRHFGVDFVARRGCPVVAVESGRVIFTGNLRRYGKTVVVRHRDFTTLYAHLKDIRVNKNQTVKMGQRIGSVGDTGNATSDHLHFEIIENTSRDFLTARRADPRHWFKRLD